MTIANDRFCSSVTLILEVSVPQGRLATMETSRRTATFTPGTVLVIGRSPVPVPPLSTPSELTSTPDRDSAHRGLSRADSLSHLWARQKTIKINNTIVSREHFRIFLGKQGPKFRPPVMVEDLASKHGTFVNDEKCTSPVEIFENTVIRAGQGYTKKRSYAAPVISVKQILYCYDEPVRPQNSPMLLTSPGPTEEYQSTRIDLADSEPCSDASVGRLSKAAEEEYSEFVSNLMYAGVPTDKAQCPYGTETSDEPATVYEFDVGSDSDDESYSHEMESEDDEGECTEMEMDVDEDEIDPEKDVKHEPQMPARDDKAESREFQRPELANFSRAEVELMINSGTAFCWPSTPSVGCSAPPGPVTREAPDDHDRLRARHLVTRQMFLPTDDEEANRLHNFATSIQSNRWGDWAGSKGIPLYPHLPSFQTYTARYMPTVGSNMSYLPCPHKTGVEGAATRPFDDVFMEGSGSGLAVVEGNKNGAGAGAGNRLPSMSSLLHRSNLDGPVSHPDEKPTDKGKQAAFGPAKTGAAAANTQSQAGLQSTPFTPFVTGLKKGKALEELEAKECAQVSNSVGDKGKVDEDACKKGSSGTCLVPVGPGAPRPHFSIPVNCLFSEKRQTGKCGPVGAPPTSKETSPSQLGKRSFDLIDDKVDVPVFGQGSSGPAGESASNSLTVSSDKAAGAGVGEATASEQKTTPEAVINLDSDKYGLESDSELEEEWEKLSGGILSSSFCSRFNGEGVESVAECSCEKGEAVCRSDEERSWLGVSVDESELSGLTHLLTHLTENSVLETSPPPTKRRKTTSWGQFIGRIALPTLTGMVIGSVGTVIGLANLPIE